MVITHRRAHPESDLALDQVMRDEAAPPRLRKLLTTQRDAYQAVMRELIVEAQRSGEVVAGDPDQLATFAMAALDGLSRLAALRPREFKKYVRDPSILLRMLRPQSNPHAAAFP